MIAAAFAAAEEIFSPPFRSVLAKTLGLTLLLLVLLGIAAEKLVVVYVGAAACGLARDDLARPGRPGPHGRLGLPGDAGVIRGRRAVFRRAGRACRGRDGRPPRGRGRALPIAPAMWVALKFGAISLLVNVVALALLLVPGVNAIAFFGANAYLLGRGFFELAALRYRDIETVRALRRRHGVRIFAAGCLCAVLMAVPLVNLLTPLFATALLVRVAQPLVRRGLSFSRLGENGRYGV